MPAYASPLPATAPAAAFDADPYDLDAFDGPMEDLTDEEIAEAYRTLENPRHEAFAFALASGASPAEAYDAAGFSSKNRKARAIALSRQPAVVARIAAIDKYMPNIGDSYWIHARPFTTMPECPARMAVWLWQVFSGARKLQPGQMQAMKLFMRLRGWDHKDVACELPTVLPVSAAPAFALLSSVQVARETHFHSAALALEGTDGDDSPDEQPAFSPFPDIPMGSDGDSNPHTQSIDSQQSTAENSEMGIKIKSSPSPHRAAPDSHPGARPPVTESNPADTPPPRDIPCPALPPAPSPPDVQTGQQNAKPQKTTNAQPCAGIAPPAAALAGCL